MHRNSTHLHAPPHLHTSSTPPSPPLHNSTPPYHSSLSPRPATMTAAGAIIPALADRPIKNTIVLFDVDETLTPSRRPASPEILMLLSRLRQRVAIGYVGGSDMAKQQEQLGSADVNVTSLFDFCFPENGLTAYRLGVPLATQSFIGWIGEENYKRLAKFCLRYISELDLPVMRGTFVEFRNGMINVSPIGRNASNDERHAFSEYDAEHKVREKMVEALRKEFSDLSLTFSIGGAISFDVFPTGWDKTYCLQHLEADPQRPDGVKFETIHFFGDKTMKGGNDFEIYSDPRTIGHSVKNPEDTIAQLKALFPEL
ncbi:PMM-domain-containing protein [Trichodelitschia bisporula]|uniref:Phosphomannomutase n=1 Tax=Trichodelitschia bisporula TaxID=703511 RepID=A0A6G1ICD2_9PEZI|nr:PMM-domain-containing protein [Trichodelitschia bisporula]